jgi:hypothetical protein
MRYLWGRLYFHNKTFAERRGEVSILVTQVEETVSKLRSLDLASPKARSKMTDAGTFYTMSSEAFQANDLEQAELFALQASDSASEIIPIETEYNNTLKVLNEARNSIAEARSEGRTTNLIQANELLRQAESTLSAGDYENTVQLAQKAGMLGENSEKEEPQEQTIQYLLQTFQDILDLYKFHLVFLAGGLITLVAVLLSRRRRYFGKRI